MDQAPTKSNLIRCKQNLAMARQAYNLLDQKRKVLIQELAQLKEEAAKLQAKVNKAQKLAELSRIQADIAMGSDRVDEFIINSPLKALASTSIALDEAYLRLSELTKLQNEMAELDETLHRLQNNIRKTQKRANALQYIVIPRHETRLRFIQNFLEERERDGFVRMKVVKAATKKSNQAHTH